MASNTPMDTKCNNSFKSPKKHAVKICNTDHNRPHKNNWPTYITIKVCDRFKAANNSIHPTHPRHVQPLPRGASQGDTRFVSIKRECTSWHWHDRDFSVCHGIQENVCITYHLWCKEKYRRKSSMLPENRPSCPKTGSGNYTQCGVASHHLNYTTYIYLAGCSGGTPQTMSKRTKRVG